MVQERIPLKNKSQTAEKMYYLIDKYFQDLKNVFVKVNGRIKPVYTLTVREFHNVIRNIPYRQDNKPIEVIARPKYLLKHRFMGLDCKKKGVLIGAFLRLKKVPYRLVGSSIKKSGRIHHVYPQGNFAGNWLNVDATYQHYRPFTKKRATNIELL